MSDQYDGGTAGGQGRQPEGHDPGSDPTVRMNVPALSGPPIVAGSGVILGVSSGPAPEGRATATVPPVLGMHQDDAVMRLQQAGFAPEVLRNPAATVPTGVVSHQYPAAHSAATSGSRAAIIVSAGPPAEMAPRTVLPEVVGMPEGQAVAALSRAELRSFVIEDFNAAVPTGVVMAQEPNVADVAQVPEEIKKSGGKGWLLAVLAIVAIAIIAAVVYFMSMGGDVTVPNVTGKTVAEATTALQDAGLELGTVTERTVADVPEGQVASQTPAAGETAAEGSRVDLVVSGEAQGVEVPDVTGDSLAKAKTTIEEAGLTWRVNEVFDDNVDEGSVVAQSPQAGTRVEEGAEIALSVSKGPEPAANVTVPPVAGMTESAAMAALEDAGLKSSSVATYSDMVPSGSVVTSAPAPGSSVAPETVVALFVSQGPAPADVTMVAVPPVSGMTEDEATTALEAAGFTVRSIEVANATVPAGDVFGAVPAEGDEAPQGSEITILVSVGP